MCTQVYNGVCVFWILVSGAPLGVDSAHSPHVEVQIFSKPQLRALLACGFTCTNCHTCRSTRPSV